MGLQPDALLETLVRIDSRNPALAPDSQGERPVAEALAEILTSLGMPTELHDVVDGRPNVIGVLPGDDSLPTYVLEAHLDTVPTPHGGIAVRREGGRLYGRGSSDTKGSLAGMVVTAERMSKRADPRPTVVVVGAVDEEFVMRGARALLDQLPRVDGVIVGEPTSLGPVTYGTDACYLNGSGGLACIVLGPGSIDQAHTKDEWIELDQVHASAAVYERVLLSAAGISD